MSHLGISVGAIALMIACVAALVAIWRLRRPRPDLRARLLAPAAPPGIPRLRSAKFFAHLPPHGSRVFLYRRQRIRSGADVAEITEKRFDSARLPWFSAYLLNPSLAHGQGALTAIYEGSEDTLPTWDGEDAPESGIFPPIWRHVESLIEAHRAAQLELVGEASALTEPAPPIWRDASALRIELAEKKGASETAVQDAVQDPVWVYASAPPIWRAMDTWGLAGLQFKSSGASSGAQPERDASLSDAGPHDNSELASAPPIWNSSVLDAWPETRAPHESEALGADAFVKPPIWASHIRQR